MTAPLSLPLHREHVLAEISRLLRVHKRPDHAPEDLREFATDYAQICGELTAAQFTGAVDAYLKSAGRWFPKPGELLALGKQVARGAGAAAGLQGQYDEWEKNAWQDPVTLKWAPCPVCDARMQWHPVRITAQGEEIVRLMVLHNAALHWKAGIGFTMKAAPGTGGGKYEHTIIDERPAPALLAEPPAPEATT